ncbi:MULTISPECIES: tryptophan synthase subunit alpha [unclassified Enterococcus]|uniref:tryptophan synthase subunit alpha n=1 Tax=unclassified Enterococcus TaxID=2608891 RepID=UPI0015517A59|nr:MULTISPECIES: tryptophan synthase subunit alpha [unclassified Enterococcus]MBS7577417.1 tryptophan synthase subunit alpha [Enterococcus sp. MMGLQ5-2]MBS7584824.1 tryptophan synthase subunit alpha [Enterococcus sp. MMGLQ5-1]NPD12679.1 tryptophan synthase subunit alpha [Enterococcus sp. MMGLQ5-1]NPD37251.1 tryptophan synthase subunit alpha [Enterococcus sp. MMGLQ5-2]
MRSLTKHLTAIKNSGRGLFVPYIMAGDHPEGLAGLEATLLNLERSGVSTIEIGIPFSDPVADGPVIQAAGIRSLKNQTTLSAIIKILQKSQVKIPLVIMSYFNPIYKYGVENFIDALKETPVKGLIIPDLPYEHRNFIEPYLEKADISLIPLVSLATSRERMKLLAEQGSGFVYGVAINGVTGTDAKYSEALFEHLAYLAKVSPIPVLAGFGVSTFEQAEKFNQVCDGVIVGSHIVQALNKGKQDELNHFIDAVVNINK